MNAAELHRFVEAAGKIRGYDWSRLRVDRDPVPWDYRQVVRRYLTPSSYVLDIGTGGGEKFLELVPYFGRGVGIDRKPEMIQMALENRHPSHGEKVSFEVMKAQNLEFAAGAFDVILNRHAPIFYEEVARVLKPGGHFITQQVGGRNAQNVFDLFGWGSNGEYWRRFFAERGMVYHDISELAEIFPRVGCDILARDDYDVRFYFQDVESLIFWLKWSPLPEDLDPNKHSAQVTKLIDQYRTPRGIETNEHRDLLVVRKTI